MYRPKRMLVGNVAWAHEIAERDPRFFSSLAQGQKPQVLWIGCADSRVPAETITHSNPGDLFVHRNIANLVCPADDNTMSVLEYAVRILKVGHIIVCGHDGCSGVRASLLPQSNALPHVNRRIAPLCALAGRHRAELDAVPDMDDRVNRLAELNVLEQVRWLRESPIVREAEPAPRVHGWIFGLADGRIRVLASGDPGAAPPVHGDIFVPAEAVA
ncbi:carbonic anhydrase [Ralstonia syzygii]|uniref:carbonic anhydrase n=1 Tax=Ralstonia syzygii R24 TaxID=907261 RepID=G3AAK1_9RALS|nr:carbonic anhydrase [Ralstonia syzygii]CCA87406.1 carbonic anhydrase protein [Ralstonia syzygii R24]